MSPEYLLWSKRHGINIPVVTEHCRTQRTYTFPGNWTHRLHRRCFDFYICYFQNNALFIIFLLLENVSAMKGKGCLIYRYIVNVNVIGSRHIKQCVTVWREESLSEISQLRRRGFLTAKQPEQGRVNERVCVCVKSNKHLFWFRSQFRDVWNGRRRTQKKGWAGAPHIILCHGGLPTVWKATIDCVVYKQNGSREGGCGVQRTLGCYPTHSCWAMEVHRRMVEITNKIRCISQQRIVVFSLYRSTFGTILVRNGGFKGKNLKKSLKSF